MKKLLLFCLFFIIGINNTNAQIFNATYYDRTNFFGTQLIDMTIDKDGRIWALSANYGPNDFYGVNYFDNNTWKTPELMTRSDMFNTSVKLNKIICDKAGNIWIAAKGCLYKFDGSTWSKHSIKDEYENDWDFRTIACDSLNNIWICNYVVKPSDKNSNYFNLIAGGFYKYYDNQWTKIFYFDSTYRDEHYIGFSDITFDYSNNLYGLYDSNIPGTGGLNIRTGDLWKTINLENPNGNDFFSLPTRILPVDTNDFWICYNIYLQGGIGNVSGYLSHWDGKNWKYYINTDFNIPSNISFAMNDVKIDKNNNVWVGFDWGLYIFRNDSMVHFDLSDYNVKIIGQDTVFRLGMDKLLIDSKNNFWCLLNNYGIVKLEPIFTDVKNIPELLVKNVEVSPNPFNNKLELKYSIFRNATISISIINSIGEEIPLINNESKEPGDYSLLLDNLNLSSGMYYIILKTNYGVEFKKLIKL